MAALNREGLLGLCERRFDDVPLRGGASVCIRSLTEGELTRQQFTTSNDKGEWSKARARDARALMLAMSLVDDDRELLYPAAAKTGIPGLSDEEKKKAADELRELHEIDAGIASAIYAACLLLNHCSRELPSAEDVIGDTEKNSETPTA